MLRFLDAHGASSAAIEHGASRCKIYLHSLHAGIHRKALRAFSALGFCLVVVLRAQEDQQDYQLINSVYLDNSSMELYHGRLDKRPNAIATRIR